MALPPKYDIEFYSADNERFILNWKSRDNSHIDFTGAVVVMTITADFNEAPVLIKIADTVPEIGRIEFDFTPQELKDLLPEEKLSRVVNWYDIRVVDGTLENPVSVKTLMRGKITIYKGRSDD